MSGELWTVRSVLLDPSKAALRRRAARFQSEPSIAGKRLGLRQPITLTADQVERNQQLLEDLVKSGSVEIIGPDGLKLFEVQSLPMTPAQAVAQVAAEQILDPPESSARVLEAPAPEVTGPVTSPEPTIEPADPAPVEDQSEASPAPEAVRSEAPKGRGRWKNRG